MRNPVVKPAHLSKAYGSLFPLSTKQARPTTWAALRAALVATISIFGLAIVIGLAGVGDPAYGWQSNETAHLMAAEQRGGYTLWQVSKLPTPPFIIEASFNEPAFHYGLWVASNDGAEQKWVVDPRGYIAYGAGMDWRPFIHVRADVNRLALQVETDGRAIWRVNDEIAWAGQLERSSMEAMGIFALANDSPNEIAFHLYTRR